MAVIPYLTAANTVPHLIIKVNSIIDFFDQRDSASELKYTPFGTITANNIQTAIQQVENQANTKINIVNSALTANVSTLNNSILQVSNSATDNAVALSIALG